jgi:hypothetical protein
MGYQSAWEMAHAVDLDTALGWHLTSNHYPPIPSAMIPVAKEAISKALDNDWDAEVDLRGICTFQDRLTASVGDLVAYMHLNAFVDMGYLDGEDQ